MKRTRNVVIGSTLVTLLAALGVGQHLLQQSAEAQAKGSVQAPRFEVDPMWPKPVPNHWVFGNIIGVGVDKNDHVYIIHRGAGSLEAKEIYAAANPPQSECCVPAPPVLEFDPEGNLVKAWGGPGQGYEWPESNHGITPDSKGNLFIGGNGGNDGHILKFTREGKFIKQFGFAYASAGSNDMWAFNKVAKISLDEGANEAYVADGYGNHRVAVIDMDTGKIKRYWGAYGNKPDDTNLGNYNPEAPLAQQFRNPVHCAEPANDGNVYVCDRPNDRIQVFTKEGKFVKETQVLKTTKGDGSVWDIAFSRDAQQKYMYLADGANEKIHVFDRQSLTELTSFGDGGRQPGQFYAVHSIATDSKGNVYTTETYRGQRLQKFVYKGLGPVTKPNQGTVWPTKTSTH
ncbi:MAG: beta-propeller fold lactonase family protein [Acidobacteria bacterium]|nr:beta-propeller fold lactonase family protein [Acidobacteriota bacterium]